jgi:hypothetical protein
VVPYSEFLGSFLYETIHWFFVETRTNHGCMLGEKERWSLVNLNCTSLYSCAMYLIVASFLGCLNIHYYFVPAEINVPSDSNTTYHLGH